MRTAGTAAAGQQLSSAPEHDEEPSSSGYCGLTLAVDEAAGWVSVQLTARDVAAEGRASLGNAASSRGRLEQEERVRKAGGPDRPLLAEGLCGAGLGKCFPSRSGDAARMRQDVRAAVVALTERAACLEGSATNEPEIRKVGAVPQFWRVAGYTARSDPSALQVVQLRMTAAQMSVCDGFLQACKMCSWAYQLLLLLTMLPWVAAEPAGAVSFTIA